MSRPDSVTDLSIRPAAEGEAAFLTALALRSKAYWGYSKQFIDACRAELTYDAGHLRSNVVRVAAAGGRIVGFYSLEQISETEAELGAIFVEPDHIGRGFGRALISHAKATARELGFASMLIQGDPHAAAFYRAAGGVPCGEAASRSISGRVLPLFRIHL